MEVLDLKDNPKNNVALFLIFLCVCTVALLFTPYAGQLYELWMNDNDASYSHGIIMPFVVAYFVWEKRYALSDQKIIPSWKGGGVAFLISSIIWLIAVGGRSRWAIEMAMVFLIISLVWLNYGSRITKHLSFPLFLLFMMVPLPTAVYGKLSFKLQVLSSKMAVGFMHLFQVPVYREGNVINLPSTSLEVAQACSGISSLISLFTLSLIFAYVSHKSFWKRFVIIISSVPIAVFMNWLRIAATGMLTHYWSEKIAQGFYHSFSGWLVFVVALVILFMENGIINRLFKPQEN